MCNAGLSQWGRGARVVLCLIFNNTLNENPRKWIKKKIHIE